MRTINQSKRIINGSDSINDFFDSLFSKALWLNSLPIRGFLYYRKDGHDLTPYDDFPMNITMKRFLTLSFVVLFVHGCTLFGIRNYELLSYDILVDEGDFQIRQYNDFVAAVTETEGSYNENRKVAHNRLFDYISGYNVQSESIAMTAPVFQKSNGETIEMTAPVVQKKSENGWIMSFILPSTYSIDSAPKPLDSKVSIEQSKGKKVAVVTYNGSLTEEAINRNTERLIDWAAQKGLTIKYPAYSAGYDPPWTLPWLKRNEVLIDVF